jgi:HD-GYP domain-containing protein (c-di-GMP phosphodiesterase class II)
VDEVPLKTRIWASVFALVTLFAMALAAITDGFEWSWSEFVFAVFIAVAIVTVEYFKVELPSASFGLYITLGAVLCLAAALALDPLLAALAVITASVLADIVNRFRPLQILVNATNVALATLAAAATYRLIADTTETPLGSVNNIAAAFVAAIVYSLVNTWGLAILVAPVLGESPYRLWRSNFSPWLFVSLTSLGSLIPVLADQHPLALLVLSVPLLGSHFAQRALRDVQEETQATMAGLADAVEVRDPYTHHHSVRVTTLVEAILNEMPHLPSDTRKIILDAARIHDLGKIGVRDAALLKQGPLTPEEFEEIKRHSSIGAELVSRLAIYRRSAAIVRHHHERWDGKGYPDGLKGEQIPLGSRIIAVADTFDAMTSDRPYRRALSIEAAIAEIQRNSGTQFDPKVVDAFTRAVADPVRMAAVTRSHATRTAERPETQITAMPAD